jgi:predicted branched-subunit amino acid permease
MGDPAAWGLDAAVPAAFLGLVWPRLTNGRERALAVAAMALSLGLTPFVAAGVPIISTALLAVAFGWKART